MLNPWLIRKLIDCGSIENLDDETVKRLYPLHTTLNVESIALKTFFFILKHVKPNETMLKSRAALQIAL
jgi:hypothetical protein